MSRTIICEGNNPVGNVVCNIDDSGRIHRGNNPVGDIFACVGSDGKIYEGNIPYGKVLATMGSDNRLYEGNMPFGHAIATVGSDGKIYSGNMPFGHVIANVPQFQNGRIDTSKRSYSNDPYVIDTKSVEYADMLAERINRGEKVVERHQLIKDGKWCVPHKKKKPSLGERICKFLFG